MAECQIVDLAHAFLRIIQPEAHKDPTNMCVISIFIVEHLTDPQVLNLSLRDVPKYLDITESKTDQNIDEKYSRLSIYPNGQSVLPGLSGPSDLLGLSRNKVEPISRLGDEKRPWHSENLPYFYWPILWRILVRTIWCITIKILTVERKVIYGLQFEN